MAGGRTIPTDRLRPLTAKRRAHDDQSLTLGAREVLQARLSELEAAQHRQGARVTDFEALDSTPASRLDAVPAGAGASRPATASIPEAIEGELAAREPTPEGAERDQTGSPLADPEHRPAPWWRRRRLLILGGVITALILNVAIVALLSQWLADGSAARLAATSASNLPPLPDGRRNVEYRPAPEYVLALRSVGADTDKPDDVHGTLEALGVSSEELRRYQGFDGYDLWSGSSRYGLTCLLVAVRGQGLREGPSAEGCALNGLDASVDLPAARSDGLIRFILSGAHVNVYLYETGEDPNASKD